MPPKAKPPIKKPLATMTIDEKRAYKLAHYYKNKDKIQLERITTVNIVVKANVPIENYNTSNINLNGSEIKNFVATVLKIAPIKEGFSQTLSTTYEELDAQYKRWDGIATITQRTKSSSTLFYSFDAIKSEVLRVFGQKSYENLLMMLYDNVIARDDFQLTMAYEKSDMVSSDNYISAYVSPLKNLNGDQIFSIEDADKSIIELKQHFARSKRVKK
ncbi:hypothetical protein T492DRAFT_836114 [Pavlovales sp. CCMP2436]|nr:hypothetical protein T492DRAFT_836114 [Pavlovales sp. CCMP2436]